MTEINLSRRGLLGAAVALPLAGLSARSALAAADMKGAGFAPYNRFKLGDFEVTTLLAGTRTVPEPQTIFGLNATPEEFTAASEAAMIPTDKAQFFFTPTLVNTGSELVLFDTGLNGAGITTALAAAGYTPDQVDVVVLTHMHGDHCLEAPHLRDMHGAKIWTMNRVVAPVSRPLHFDYCAQVNTYGKGIDSIAFDKVFQEGDTFTWEGFKLTVDWMPGQTEFALCLHGIIDGKKVAFTGDNIFGSSSDPSQNGHEAVVARNSCILEEGYIYAAKYLKKLQEDKDARQMPTSFTI